MDNNRNINPLFLLGVTIVGLIGLAALFSNDKSDIEFDEEESNGFETDAKNFQKDFENISKDFHSAKKKC